MDFVLKSASRLLRITGKIFNIQINNRLKYLEKSDNFRIFNGMKGPNLTLILQQQLDVANETNRILLARIDDLVGRTIEELRAELAISNLKREELMATVMSMQKALLERDTDLSK